MKVYLTRGIVCFDRKYLLLKKAKDITFDNVGKWEVPGGKIEEGEVPTDALLREIKEETGLDCEVVKELPLLEKSEKGFESKCHVFLVKAFSDDVKLSSEHSSYKWVTSEEVKNMPLVLFADLLLKYLELTEEYFS